MVDVKRIVFFPTVNSQLPECWLLHHCLHLCSTANADSGGLFWLGSGSRILPRWWGFISSPSSTKAWSLLYTHHSSSLLDQPSLNPLPPASAVASPCCGMAGLLAWWLALNSADTCMENSENLGKLKLRASLWRWDMVNPWNGMRVAWEMVSL